MYMHVDTVLALPGRLFDMHRSRYDDNSISLCMQCGVVNVNGVGTATERPGFAVCALAYRYENDPASVAPSAPPLFLLTLSFVCIE